MPDIAMCPNYTCPQREKCYTYMCVPSPLRQSYMGVRWTKNEDGTISCRRFRPIHPADRIVKLRVADKRNRS